MIEERINRERPCRTLFIRNIKAGCQRFDVLICSLMMCVQYETNSDDVYRRFSAHGDIKTFFDLISNRGMVFVTYVSLQQFLTLPFDLF